MQTKEQRKIWDVKNKERIKKQKREWVLKNRNRHLELKRLSYHRHKTEISIRRKKYCETNREMLNANRRQRDFERKDEINLRSKLYRSKNGDKVKAWREKSRLVNRHKHIFWSIQKTCKGRGIYFALTPTWIKERLDRGVCELTGIAFDMIGKRTSNSPSIDRIIPGGPYIPENCRMILWSLNRGLNNYGLDYMLTIFEMILRKRKPEIFI